MCRVSIRLRPAADGNAILRVEKLNRFQAAGHTGVLQLPRSSAVARVPDHAAVAHRPAAIGIDEGDGRQLGVLNGLWRRRLGLRANDRSGGEKYEVLSTKYQVRTECSHPNRLPPPSRDACLNP